MPFPTGQGSYIGVAQQTSWGGSLVSTGLSTFPNLGGGEVLSAVAGKAARQSVTGAMSRASHTFKTMSLVNVGWSNEFVCDPTAHRAALTAAWGLRTVSATISDTYKVTTSLPDAGTDAGNDFYNHALSFHAFISHNGTSVSAQRYSVKDVIITNFEWAGVANGTTTMTFQGTGRNLLQSTSTVAFTDQTGAVMNWNHVANDGTKGIYADTTATPTAKMVCQSFRFNLAQPHRFEPALGDSAGTEMRFPTRQSLATATLALEMFYEDYTGTDPVAIGADFINSVDHGVQIYYRHDDDNFVQLNAKGSVDPATLNNPRWSWTNSGPVGFSFNYDIYPDAIADLNMVLGTTAS